MDERNETLIRDLARAHLDSKSLDEYYRTFFPRSPMEPTAWNPVSNLSQDEIRKTIIAYHLKRKWKIESPAQMTDDYQRLVVSRNAMGRFGAERILGGQERKRRKTLKEMLWPFGNPPGDGGD